MSIDSLTAEFTQENTRLSVTITNRMEEEIETDEWTETETEIMEEEPGGSTPTGSSSEETVSSGTSVKMRDETPWTLYITLFVAAAVALAALVLFGRKRRSGK